MSAVCYAQLSTWACSNSSGTTCTKTQIYFLSSANHAPPCAAGEYPVFTQTEYDQFTGSLSTVASHTTAIAALQAASSPGGGATSAQVTSLQASVSALQASDATLGVQFKTLQDTIGSNGMDPATIAASTTMFGAFLVALVAVWASKRLYSLFNNMPGGE